MGNRRRPSLKRLYADLRDAPPNVASLEVTAEGFKVTFREQRGAPGAEGPHTPVVAGSTPASATKLIAGTPFPDDESPIDVADLTLHPLDLEESN